MPTTDDATRALSSASASAMAAAGDALRSVCERIPEGVRTQATHAYKATIARLQAAYDELPPSTQRSVLLAATAITTVAVSHYAHAWYFQRRLARAIGRAGTDGARTDGDKKNESNTIYESEVSARQYMEFHYTPSKSTYVQKLTMIQESFDFPVRVAAKFGEYSPRTPAFLAASQRSSEASGTTRGSLEGSAPVKKRRALDIGCATGASVFEMSKFFDEVIGIDYSEVFVHLANEVKSKSLRRPQVKAEAGQPLNIAPMDEEASTTGQAQEREWAVSYTAPVQGVNTQRRELVLSPGVFPERCFFYCGDAMDFFVGRDAGFSPEHSRRSTTYQDVSYWKTPLLPGAAQGPATLDELLAASERATEADDNDAFDAVLCSNLIDRVPEPRKLLAGFALLLKKGGVLVLCDPYSWWEGATPKRNWIGGRDGLRSEDEIKQLLSGSFELLAESEEPFLIRDHVRRYQLGFSHCTVWRRV